MKNLRKISLIAQILMYASAFGLALIWLCQIKVPFDAEAGTFILLAILAPLISYLNKKYLNEIEVEKFSTANALAYGYINNYVEPVITQLLRSKKKPEMYIYIPERLSELTPKSIERIKLIFKEKHMNVKTDTIKLDEGRGARDILTLEGNYEQNVYFDFPNTLLTLERLIEYKIRSPQDSLNENEKFELGKLYIAAFKDTVYKLLKEKSLDDYVKFIDKSLQFENLN